MKKKKREENTRILKIYLKKHCKKFFKITEERCKRIGLTLGKMLDAVKALESEGILEQREKNSNRKTYVVHKERIEIDDGKRTHTSQADS